MRIGLAGVDSSHAEDFLRHFNTEGRHRDVSVTAFWGSDAQRAAELLAFAPSLQTADSLDDLVAEVDAVIIGDRHGDLHLPHALPCIAAGKPVFIDKPLACSVSDAEALLDAAEAAGTPLLSASALRWQTDTVMLKARLAYVEGPLSLRGYGTWYPDSEYGGAIFYAIHTLELMQELAGPAWSDLRLEPGEEPVISYRAGPTEVAMAFRRLDSSGSSSFGVSVASPRLRFEAPISLPGDYMLPVVDRIAEMLRTGKSSMGRDSLLAPVRMMEEINALLGR